MAQKGQKQRTNGAVGKTHGNQTPPHTIAQQRTFGVWLKRFAEPNPRWWRDEVPRLANCQSIEQKQLKVDLPGRVFKCKYGKSLNKSANKKKKPTAFQAIRQWVASPQSVWPVRLNESLRIGGQHHRPMRFLRFFFSGYARGQTEFPIKNSISCRTHRIELVLPLHVVLYEHDVVDGLFQLERILFACGHIAQRVVQSG